MWSRDCLKRSISTAYDVFLTGNRILLGRAGSQHSVCLMYHRICKEEPTDRWSVKLDDLKEQLRTVRGLGYTMVRCEDILKSSEPACCISFDDGTSLECGTYEYLASQNIPFTIFAVSSFLGMPGYLTEEAIAKLAAEEIVSVGGHSVSHKRLDRIPVSQLYIELVASKALLEQVCRKPVTMLSYPHGGYNKKTIAAAGRAGYKFCFTSDLKPIQSDCDPLTIPRIEIWQDEDHTTLTQKMRGAWGWTCPLSP